MVGDQGIDILAGTIMPNFFFGAIIIFGFVGIYAFFDVSTWMQNEFEKATVDKTEVEKALKDAKAAISIKCSKCGKPLEADMSECPKCGSEDRDIAIGDKGKVRES